jgi:hypothetical protein
MRALRLAQSARDRATHTGCEGHRARWRRSRMLRWAAPLIKRIKQSGIQGKLGSPMHWPPPPPGGHLLHVDTYWTPEVATRSGPDLNLELVLAAFPVVALDLLQL